jgi:hypothetical protein
MKVSPPAHWSQGKSNGPAALLVALLLAFFLSSAHWSVVAAPAVANASEPSAVTAARFASQRDAALRWGEFSRGLSEITAAAVSPLLVVSVAGAARYLRTPEAERRNLPSFCDPLLWGTGLALLLSCFFKDLLGAVLPAPLKKPLDMLEILENKLSALVAATVFVPVITWEMMQHFGTGSTAWVAEAGVHTASLPFPAGWHPDPRWLMVPACLICFCTVWLTAHLVNVLVAICPIGFIDALLKVFKNGVLALIVASSAVHPWLGAGVSLLLLFFAMLLAGIALRFAVFGTILALDTLLIWSGKRGATPGPARVFVSGGSFGVPALTHGRLERGAGGAYMFHYRRWPFFRASRVELPRGEALLRRNLISVSFLLRTESGEEIKFLEFPPRYRRHVEILAGYYNVAEIRDGAFIGGMKGVFAWASELLGLAAPALNRPEAPAFR